MTPEQLKASILQYAIQGKLVEQRAEEGTAEELYQQIQAEEQRLIQEGKIKKEKPLAEIAEDEIPFDIPKSWKWVRLGKLIRVISGTSYNKNVVTKNGLRVLRGGNIYDMRVTIGDDDVFLPLSYDEEEKRVRKGDILIVASTGSKAVIGKPGYVDRSIDDTVIGAFLRICRPVYEATSLYLKCVFESEYYRKHIREKAQGTNINNIKEAYLTEFVVPLPPLREQVRISTKIEELLPLVDRYAVAYEKLEKFNAKFPEDMKKSILQYTIQGKLVEQRPEDGTGEELYQQIQDKKQWLVKEGKIKKEKPLPEITEDEVPFDIPESWKWVRLQDITTVLGDGIHGTPQYTINGGYYFINGNNLAEGRIEIKSDTKQVDVSEYGKHKKPLDTNTILISINGTIGNYAFYEGEPIILGKSACYFSLLSGVSKEYICMLIKSKVFFDYAKREATQTTIKNVSLKSMRMLPVPLPPLAEQKRIVEKLEELLPLCERLK